MNRCEHLKKILVDLGPDAIHRNEGLVAHLQDCPACQQLLQAWTQIPDLLDQLPEHEPGQALLHKVREVAASPGTSSKVQRRSRTDQNRRRFIAPSLASAAVLLAAIGLSRELLMHESPAVHVTPSRQRSAGESLKGPETESPAGRFDDSDIYPQNLEVADNLQADLNEGLDESFDYRGDDAPFFGEQEAGQSGREIDQLQRSGARGSHADSDSGFKPSGKSRELGLVRPNKNAGNSEFQDFAKEVTRDLSLHYESQPEVVSEDREEFSVAPSAAPQAQHRQDNKRLVTSSLTTRLALATPAEEIRKSQARAKADREISDREFNQPINGFASHEYDEAARATEPESGKMKAAKTNTGKPEFNESEAPKMGVIGGAGAYANTGFDFLTHYRQTQNLQFQPARGYWANTYVPGDPEIRLLSARLAQWDRSWLENNAALEQDVEPVKQPFDAPADNALALNLMADARSVSANDALHGPTRMRLQVGIRGIEHRRGQRPAMNVGVVVDLPADASDEVRIATRALLDSMLQSKQAGDRFSLVMTGRKNDVQNGGTGSLVVPAKDFRFGSLQLAIQHILGNNFAAGNEGRNRSAEQSGNKLESSSLELYGAVERAGAMVQQTDDPSRPLGSSSVLLISANTMPDVDQLAALVHARAKEGITLSVIPLGSQPQNSNVEKLVLAGLGNRRYLEAPGQARQLIEEELHASSRAVARAARLSIRLAPGVRLIDVLGSERLDTQRAQRVREIENSMDRRLSANLGIQADRGEDEDGIQIVIPSIYSGDSLTVLLDVVTDRPGAIADVSLRYKDLVFLRNGKLRGHLDLPQGTIQRGPAEFTVLKNLLTHHFIEAVEQAATALGRGQAASAITILSAMRSTIDNARRDLPEWANDPDLIRDQQVLDRYIAALASPRAGAHQPFLADSLRYAAWAKAHRPLEEWK